MEAVQLFYSAIAGSAAVEAACVYACHVRGREVPTRYRRASFYLAWLLLSLIAGYLAIIIPCGSYLLAFGVGAAMPKIITKVIKWVVDKFDL